MYLYSINQPYLPEKRESLFLSFNIQCRELTAFGQKVLYVFD